MTDVTVRQFADVVGLPVDRLLAQLGEAGLSVSDADDTISDKEKAQLLSYLRKSHGKSESLSVSQPKRVTLKRKSHSELRTTASRTGSARTVSVEVRKKRTYVKRADLMAVEEERLKQEAEEKAKLLAEREAKRQAEQEALRRAEEEAARKVEEERQRAEEVARKAQDEAAQQAEEVRKKAEQEALVQARAEQEARAQKAEHERKGKRQAEDDRHTKYGRQELHVAKDKTGRRKKKKAPRSGVAIRTSGEHGFERPTAPVVREVEVPEAISVADLAQKMSIKGTDLIKSLMKMGIMATINQSLDQDTAVLLVEEMGHNAKVVSERDLEAQIEELAAKEVSGERVAAAAGGNHHGARRPRQDLTARSHPQYPGGGRRSRRHYPAHRCLPCRDRQRCDQFSRHTGPRGVHGDARARCQGDRHRHPGRGRR